MAIKHGSRVYSRIEEQLLSKAKQSFFNLFFWSVIEWLGSKDEGNGMQLSQDHLTNFNTNNPVAGSDLHTANSGKPSNNDSDAGLCSRLIMYNRFLFLIIITSVLQDKTMILWSKLIFISESIFPF